MTSFSSGVSAIARRPSSKARSLRPRAASIKPEDAERRAVIRLRLHDLLLLGASRFKRSARSCLIFGHARQQPFAKAAAQSNRASLQHGLSPSAMSASSAAAGSRSARAQKNQVSAALAIAPGPCARIASIVWWSGRVSAFQKRYHSLTIGPRFDVVGHDR